MTAMIDKICRNCKYWSLWWGDGRHGTCDKSIYGSINDKSKNSVVYEHANSPVVPVVFGPKFGCIKFEVKNDSSRSNIDA